MHAIKSAALLTIHILLLTITGDCLPQQIPSRFFYDNRQGPLNESAEDLDGSESNTKVKLLEENVTDAIPLEFYMKLDNVSDIGEFIEKYVDQDSIDPKLGIQENLKRSVERAAAVIPKPANCMAENTIVQLTPHSPSKDPKVFYYPKCTRVKRCSGCCSSELMSCQPIEVEIINFEITRYHYGDRPSLNGKEIVAIEQHNKCRCGCRIKEQDCNAYQIYRPDLCRCLCTNDEAQQKCLAQEHKLWDEKDCRCVCRDSQSCTTGTIFNEHNCKCEDINHVEFFD